MWSASRREARRRAKPFHRAIETRDLLRRDGHNVQIVSGASTGTYNIDATIAGVTEMQAGSYIFMDVEYQSIGGTTGHVYSDFVPRAHRSRDGCASLRAKSDRRCRIESLRHGSLVWSGTSRYRGREIRICRRRTGRLTIDNPSRPIALGDKLRFVIPHCDPNVNLYDTIF